MKAAEVLATLEKKHPLDRWAFFPELRVGTGYGKKSEQRIDAWAIHYYPSMSCKCVAYEIKTQRADWLKEMSQPRKRVPALLVSNEFYFAASPGLIRPHEVPLECGLIEVDPSGSTKITVAAPWRDISPPNFRFLASVLRRGNEIEKARVALDQRNCVLETVLCELAPDARERKELIQRARARFYRDTEQ